MKMDYEKSKELAIANGYQEIPDSSAYMGAYFLKDDKKWIHNIDALKHHLGGVSRGELESLGYDVDAYSKREYYTNEMADNEMRGLYQEISVEEGKPVYLSDGMYLFPDGSIEEL